MNTLVKHRNPFPTFSRDPFTSLACDLFGIENLAAARNDAPKAGSPRFDLIESTDLYTLRGDVPGLEDKDLDISVHQGLLSISGSYENEEITEGEQNYVVRERRFGDFTRSLKLPKDADAQSISAKLNKGVLTVKIQKKEEVKARKIQIG